MPGRRAVTKKKAPELVESMREFTGLDPVRFYSCPGCGRSGEDKALLELHVSECPAAAEQANAEAGETE